jgi:hypothetical protein
MRGGHVALGGMSRLRRALFAGKIAGSDRRRCGSQGAGRCRDPSHEKGEPLNGNGCRAAPGVLFALALLCVHMPVSAGAGEIPTSAYSQSLLVPGVFLDHPNLVYQFPHRAAGLPAEILASTITSGGSSDYTVAAGANTLVGRHALFFLSQQYAAFSSQNSLRLLQAGWAFNTGQLAVGVALRGGRFRHASDYEEILASDTRRNEEIDSVDYREGAVGIGLTRGGFQLDLVFEVYEEESAESDYTRYEVSSDSAGYKFDPQDVILTKSSVRAKFPLSEGTSLVIGGGYRETSSVLDITLTRMGASQPPTTEQRTGSYYGHRWDGGFCIAKFLNRGGTGRLFAYYANDRKTRLYREGYSYDLYVGQTSTVDQTASVGFSLETPVWRECTMLAGFQGVFSHTKNVYFSDWKPTGVDESKMTHEYFQQRFAWGLGRSFRGLTLTGSVQTDLEISSPFLALDAQLLF